MATSKQQKALAKIVENGGNVSKAMRDVGYSANTAKTPQKLTESKAFIEYMEKAGVTDEKLTTVIREGLDASKAVVMGKESQESFVDVQPDYAIRHKYLETALRVKGIGQDKGSTNIQNFGQMIMAQREKYND